VFDLVLTRLYKHWFSVKEEWVGKFWNSYGEEKFTEDPLEKGMYRSTLFTYFADNFHNFMKVGFHGFGMNHRDL
jgi:hypothetical protein